MRFLPTSLSLLRLFAAAPAAMLTIHDWFTAALIVCVSASLSDFLDGYLARRFGWVSQSGAWADAVADKVYLGVLFLALMARGLVPEWFVALLIGRDLMILLLAAIGLALRMRDFPPSFWGKLSTAVQMAFSVGILARLHFSLAPLLGLCVLTTAWSGLHYFYSAFARWSRL